MQLNFQNFMKMSYDTPIHRTYLFFPERRSMNQVEIINGFPAIYNVPEEYFLVHRWSLKNSRLILMLVSKYKDYYEKSYDDVEKDCSLFRQICRDVQEGRL